LNVKGATLLLPRIRFHPTFPDGSHEPMLRCLPISCTSYGAKEFVPRAPVLFPVEEMAEELFLQAVW
jgi:hypothetical protein